MENSAITLASAITLVVVDGDGWINLLISVFTSTSYPCPAPNEVVYPAKVFHAQRITYYYAIHKIRLYL
ncbi:MAG: hypothetical protein ACFFAM_00985 [Promethearchaeota archaeon]